ncbi:hypothetical protein [Streptomyces canus]|uniref:hypothetical protein n=1 Tax=Streptomyces canus TaxID=58343 RepID=UPI002DD91111|nr:hypothetical protein [Streptomyces canus]WSD83333.1 hypothetical protein OG925_03045 [Streptomyces canus]
MAESTTSPAHNPKRRKSSIQAEAQFRRRVTDLGGTITGAYVNNRTPVEVRCAEGHACSPKPYRVILGHRVCLTCPLPSQQQEKPVQAEARFYELVAEQGGTLVGSYVNNRTRVELLCPDGHACSPKPDKVLLGGGICPTCVRRDPKDSEARFRALIAAYRATIVGEYVNTATPVALRRVEGHRSRPVPSSVLRGNGVCFACRGRLYDALYVVGNDKDGTVKFGITSGDPQPRLGVHARAGFHDVIRLHTGLPEAIAPELEQNILAALRDSREQPVRGREYFPDPPSP